MIGQFLRGVGVPLVQSADLTSIKNGNGKNLFGYSAYLSVDKAITHAFGLNPQYEMGETKQGMVNVKKMLVWELELNIKLYRF